MKTNRYAPKKDSKDVSATTSTGRRPAQGQEELQRMESSRAPILGLPARPSFLHQKPQPLEPTGSQGPKPTGSQGPKASGSAPKPDPRPRNPKMKVYPCDHCSKVFTTRQNLMSHIRILRQVYPFKCDSCEMAFIEYSTLFKHKKIHAKVREKFECNQCEMTYLSKPGLKKHQKKFHPVVLDAKDKRETTLTVDKSSLAVVAKDVHEPAEKMGKKVCSKTVIQESQPATTTDGETNVPGATDVISATSDIVVISDVAVATPSVTATSDVAITNSNVTMVTSDPEVPSVISSENVRGSPTCKQLAKPSSMRSDHVFSETIQFETSPKLNRTKNEKDGDKTATGATVTSERRIDVCDNPVEKSKEHSAGKRKGRRQLLETKSRTANKENAQTSLRNHGCGRRYNCKFCPESFPQAILLKTHVETTHLDSKRYNCCECDRVFANPKALEAHAEKHIARKFECKTCNKIFAQKITLDGHLRCHTREQPFQCDVCDRKFAHYQSRDAHMRFHTREKAYRCQICDFRTSWRSSMSAHLKLHKGERPHKCEQCAMRFTQKSQLKRHMQGVHNPEKKCKVCGDYVKNRKAMIAHLAEHNGDNPFQCEYCDDGFVKKFQLKKHVLEAHTLPNRCDECGAAFAYPSGLKVHKLSHTQKRDFRCDFENCGASFARVGNLNAHRRLHTGNLPHTCDLCNRKFDRRALLVVHVRNFHEAKRNRSAPRKSKYRDYVPCTKTPETRTDSLPETAPTIAIPQAETESQSEDTIIVTIPATEAVPTPRANSTSTRAGSDVETRQDTATDTPPAVNTVSTPAVNTVSTQQNLPLDLTVSNKPPESTVSEVVVDVPNSGRRLSESDASFELSLERQSISGSHQYMEVNSVTTPPQSMTPLRNPDMEFDARSSAGSDRQPASPHSPFTERLRQCLSPPKTLAPVEIWTASDAGCFTVSRVPQPDGSQGAEFGFEDLDAHNGSSGSVDIGAAEGTDGLLGDEQRPRAFHQYQVDSHCNFVVLSQSNEATLLKYKATSLTKRKDGESTSSESTVGVPRRQDTQSQQRMDAKTGEKRKMRPLSVMGGTAKRQRVTKSPQKTSKPKGKIGTSPKTVKSKGSLKQKLKSKKLHASSPKRNVAKGGDALKSLARSRKVSNTSKGKRKISAVPSRPKPDKGKIKKTLSRKIVPSSSGTKLTPKSTARAKTKLKPVKRTTSNVNTKTPSSSSGRKKNGAYKMLTGARHAKGSVRPKSSPAVRTSISSQTAVKKNPTLHTKTPVKSFQGSKAQSPKNPAKARHVSKTPSPKKPAKTSPVSKMRSTKTPVNTKSVSKTPKTTKRILAAKVQRKVSRRPVADTQNKRTLGLKKMPRKSSVVLVSSPSGNSTRPKKPVLKRPRVVRATVRVQDLPIAPKGKSKQTAPRRKVSNSRSQSGNS